MSSNDGKSRVAEVLLREHSLWDLSVAVTEFLVAKRGEEDDKLASLINAANAASEDNDLLEGPETIQQLRNAVAAFEDEVIRLTGLFGIMAAKPMAASAEHA